MKSIKSYAENFFEANEIYLQKNYPGISLNRIIQELKDISQIPLYIDNTPFFELENDPYFSFFQLLRKGVPLEYISNRAYFFTSEFYVNPSVLIPRSETEILVEMAVSIIKKNNFKSFIDIGVGSGNILISIIKELTDPVTTFGIDISMKAIDVARKNLEYHRYQINPATVVVFQTMDRLSSFCGNVDLVVSNPPYIKRSEASSGVHSQVDRYEPNGALYLDDENYKSWFFDLFVQTYDVLNPGGLFIMEGHEDLLAGQIVDLEAVGFVEIKIVQDYTHRNRFIMAMRRQVIE